MAEKYSYVGLAFSISALLAVAHCYTSSPRQCPFTNCPTPCFYGKVQDSKGCPTCQCKPNPNSAFVLSEGCEKCYMYCPWGREQGRDGCLACRCRTTPFASTNEFIIGRPLILPELQSRQCPQLNCLDRICPNGFEVDSNDCTTCICKNDSPSPPAAAAAATDDDDDVKLGCTNRLCRNFCFQGRELDSNGCNTCKCKLGAYGSRNLNAGRNVNQPVQINCPLVRCSNQCPEGLWAVDQRGCPSCQCQRSSTNG